MDELENLRKRAKQLVRDHRAGLVTLPERLRQRVTRFAELSDREILDARFTLSDSQRVVARDLGFDSWEELVASTERPKPAPPPTLGVWRVFPQVFVRDVTSSLAWYLDVLGCRLDYVYGSPPFYAQLSRAGIVFNLRHSTIAPWHPSTPDQDLLAMRIEVDDATALYRELRNHDVNLHQPLRREPWGQQTFIVADPDGNLISFGSHLPDQSAPKEIQ